MKDTLLKPETPDQLQAESGSSAPICSALVMPAKMATIYLSEEDGPYRMEIRESEEKGGAWAYFYKGEKLVWDCNEGFAKHHFYSVPNAESHRSCNDKSNPIES